ncbi:8-oxo-dGTP pyrophosphatase MutT (NUDIX family) [Parvibaculum indicum]|uniref:NUDIX hydrolase n=1 Tax=Parvibaculum indicum TaxID=562969 RepID=UPI001421C469|nr:NUDIX hydrolase [Parvibaculum indicum]NIJ40154.1 8-oxo-dGTP pyrophosphatase MutT (NUDIX family) [Parvibaculum indicum]
MAERHATGGDTLIPSSTILLLRDGAEGLEVFMVVRHHQIDFASGALVFPGGKVDKADYAQQVRARVDGAEAFDDTLLALRVAAIREAFEEAGVLLARNAQTGDVVDAARLATLEPYRDALNKGELGIAEFLERENLRVAVDMLTPFAHWITPNMMPKRFDTHFYLAEAPADHLAVHDGSESVDSVWIRPQIALEEAQAGKRTIIFPTRMNVEKVGRSANVAHAIEEARNRPIVTVEPQVTKNDAGEAILRIPAEAGYSVTDEPLDAVANVAKPKAK